MKSLFTLVLTIMLASVSQKLIPAVADNGNSNLPDQFFNKVYRLPANIDTTGALDVSQPINDFLSAAPDGATVEFREGAIYRCDQPIMISGKKNIKLNGKGAIIIPAKPVKGNKEDYQSHLFTISNCGGLQIKNLILRGIYDLRSQRGKFDPSTEVQVKKGIEVSNAQNIQIEFIRIEDTEGVYIDMSGAAPSNVSKNISIKYCIFQRGGNQAVSAGGAEQVAFEYNYIDGAILPAGNETLILKNNTFSPRATKRMNEQRNTRALTRKNAVEMHGNLMISDWPQSSGKAEEVTSRSLSEKVIKVPDDIDATGKTDVTKALNEFLLNVPSESTILFPHQGTFRCEGPIGFSKQRDLKVEGNGSMIIAHTTGKNFIPAYRIPKNWPRNRYHLSLNNCSNIIIQNLYIRGPHEKGGTNEDAYNPKLEAQHGINIVSCQDITLHNLRIENVHGDFVYIGMASPSSSLWSKNIAIRNSIFRKNGRQGIGIVAGENVVIENNYIGQTRRASIDLEPNTPKGGAQSIFIRNNTFGPGRLMWIASAGAGGNIGDIVIEGNILAGKSPSIQMGRKDYRRGPITIKNNISAVHHGNPNEVAWKFRNIDGIKVTGNFLTMQKNRKMHLVGTINCSDIEVKDNILPFASGEIGEWKFLSNKKAKGKAKPPKKNKN